VTLDSFPSIERETESREVLGKITRNCVGLGGIKAALDASNST